MTIEERDTYSSVATGAMTEPPAATNTSDLPLRPVDSAEDTADKSPPRKRPRTRAPLRVAVSTAINETPNVAPQPSTSTPAIIETFPGLVYHFSVQPLNRFRGASASIKRPREVAHFSYDDNHEYKDDESGINYYIPPPMGVDMKEGFETFRHYEDKEDPHLDSLLQALMIKERKEGKEKRVQGDFVTWRGMMTKIMTAPFDNFAEFSMFATLHDGTIYIEEDFPSRAAERAAESSRPPPRHQHPDQQSREMMTYWGYKFETLSLIPTPPATTPREEIERHQRSVVSNYAQHCSIVNTSFGPHSLILGGEVDGLLAPKPTTDPTTPIPWVELKTSEELPPPHLQSHRDITRFERKLLKFWAQSFLLGVPTIIVGFRSKSGVLKSLQTFGTQEIPGMVRRGTGVWDGNVCINFATEFLGWLKGVVRGEGVWSVKLRKKSGVVEVRKVVEGTGGILSEEFLKWREGGKKEDGGDEDGQKEGDA